MSSRPTNDHTFHTQRSRPWAAGIAAILILLAAWLYGFLNTRSPVAPLVSNVLPGAERIEAQHEIFAAYDSQGKLLGYAAAADATGYGGPIYLLVGVDPGGEIAGIQVIEQRETPGFYALLRDRRFVEGFLTQDISQAFLVGENVDAVSGATLSAEAVAQAINRAGQAITAGALAADSPSLRVGLPEISLLALFATSVTLTRFRVRLRRYKNALRWVVLFASIVTLGFMFNLPLTIANFASLLAGYWPSWQDHLYWYLLLAGAVGLAILEGRNTYCYYVCPFGAVQECLGKMGNARPNLPPGVYARLKWVPRWLAVLALALGLAFRQPGAASFEPFGTLFSFSAGFFPWMLLVVVLFASIIILRPFCYFLCPVGATLDFILYLRKQTRKAWKKRRAIPAG